MRIPEMILFMSICGLAGFGLLYVLESSYQRIDTVCQEGCR